MIPIAKLFTAAVFLMLFANTAIAAPHADSSRGMLVTSNTYTGDNTHTGNENFTGTLKINGDKVARPVVSTEQVTTSGTSFSFSIPSGAKRITVILLECSLSGTDNYLIQLSTGGAAVTTGYVATSTTPGVAIISSTSGFPVRAAGAAVVTNIVMTFTLENASNNTWASSGVGDSTTVSLLSAGHVSLSGEVDGVVITRTGSNTFDAGKVNIMAEY